MTSRAERAEPINGIQRDDQLICIYSLSLVECSSPFMIPVSQFYTTMLRGVIL